MKIMLKTGVTCLLTLTIGFLLSCQKNEVIGTLGIAKVNVVNAVVGGGGIKVNVSPKEMSWSSIPENQVIGYGTGKLYMVSTDKSTHLKVVRIVDTTQIWYNRNVNLKKETMYTLYLSGTPSAVDTLFCAETKFPKPISRDPGHLIPAKDSVVNIRFVNLSTSGPVVDINIEGHTTNEVTGLGYQQFTDFKSYLVTDQDQGISLEIRNSLTEEVIATYQVDVSKWGNLFKTISIVIMGAYDPDWSLSIPDQDRYMVTEVPYDNVTY
ncbi:hypothetical protein [Sphingobacterium sp. UDSM-2020]|uniref:hypothetical protein n=1 Tax=Sphingobacterium sp. UDSM-2020 TaxID=2795738 RepID=UPI001934D541|nr:hypothetical protein [Sphingobacterium sp. UDSM-2020]QQD16040.1 hypothetical protein JAZ75_11190 [Sphingobacterium sp. UDSM-2020]